MEIERMNDKELVAALDHYYLEECPFHDEIDASVVPLMIDRLRDEFKIFYRPGIFTPVEPHVCKVNKELEEKYEKLKERYDAEDAAYIKFKSDIAAILRISSMECNNYFLEMIKGLYKAEYEQRKELNSLFSELADILNTDRSNSFRNILGKVKELVDKKDSDKQRIDDLISKCNELIEENKNLKKIYKNSIEKQYRLETENAELLRKVKIQDDSEEVISKLKSKLEETENLLHKSVEKVNEECKICVQYERKKIKYDIIDYLKKEHPIFYSNHTVELITNPLEDIFKMLADK